MSHFLPIEKYKDLPSASFPLVIEKGIAFDAIDFACNKCDSEMIHVKAISRRLNARCVEVFFGAICKQCNRYDSVKMRWYHRNNRMLLFSDSGLDEITLKPQLQSVFWRYVGFLIFKKKGLGLQLNTIKTKLMAKYDIR